MGTATTTTPVPAPGKYYMPVQCQQCDNAPCVKVCPVEATWKETDGIVVVDYNWCIGCRYCEAACPYHARRFNWTKPEVPAEEINPDQGYLSNRIRPQGVVEKCTFCLHRTREGRLPACLEACPTGARVFGNLLDPDSEIRWVLENKRVFVLKEELGTQPAVLLLLRRVNPPTSQPAAPPEPPPRRRPTRASSGARSGVAHRRDVAVLRLDDRAHRDRAGRARNAWAHQVARRHGPSPRMTRPRVVGALHRQLHVRRRARRGRGDDGDPRLPLRRPRHARRRDHRRDRSRSPRS